MGSLDERQLGELGIQLHENATPRESEHEEILRCFVEGKSPSAPVAETPPPSKK